MQLQYAGHLLWNVFMGVHDCQRCSTETGIAVPPQPGRHGEAAPKQSTTTRHSLCWMVGIHSSAQAAHLCARFQRCKGLLVCNRALESLPPTLQPDGRQPLAAAACQRLQWCKTWNVSAGVSLVA